MPRSKDPRRYPQSYFDALTIAQRRGQHEITCGSKATAESLRLNFSSLRAGIIEQNFTPYCHFAPGYKFLVRPNPHRLLITWGGNDDLTQLVTNSLPPSTSVDPQFVASHSAEHARRDSQQSADFGAIMQTVDEDEAIKRAREKLGLPEPSPEDRVRTPDELLSDLLKLKDRK